MSTVPDSTTVDAPERTGREPLWTSAFAKYFTARTTSRLRDEMMPVALAVAVLGLGHGAAGVGYVMAAFIAPEALFVIFGGVLADRFTARRMMIGADLARLLVHAALSVLFVAGDPALWLILTLAVVSGSATAMFQPGVSSMVPLVCEDVQRGNGALRVAEAVGSLLGPALGAVLVATLGAGVVFAANAATFTLSMVFLLLLKVAPPPVSTGGSSLWENLQEGWYEFRARRWLWAVIVVWAVNGPLVWGPARPLTATVIIGDHGSSGFGTVQAALGAGTIVGGLIAMRLRPAHPLAAGSLAMFGFALHPLAMVFDFPVWALGCCFAVAGASWTFWGVQWTTTVQTQVQPEVLNRVYAYDVAGSIMTNPIGRALAGPPALLLGARETLFIGVLICGASCVTLLSMRTIRTLRRRGATP
ncbi:MULTISPECIES: MFS transporter [unclassified Streptomyces]|uniref:MFS transporter n=1 Tax=unclassified Streptomyces TaxID=2593676 RepID=UPI00278BCF14|nr:MULTISPECIES: MFS transporter [unclassified Streptomyces]